MLVKQIVPIGNNQELNECCKNSLNGHPYVSCEIFEPDTTAYNHTPLILSAPFPDMKLNGIIVRGGRKNGTVVLYDRSSAHAYFQIVTKLFHVPTDKVIGGLQFKDKTTIGCYMMRSCNKTGFLTLVKGNCQFIKKVYFSEYERM